MLQTPFIRLIVWQKSIMLNKMIYECSSFFPKREMFGLTFQIRKAAVSIASNIAEGSQRTTEKDFNYFLSISRGSLAEVQTQLYIAYELQYLSRKDFDQIGQLSIEISKMLLALQKKLVSSY